MNRSYGPAAPGLPHRFAAAMASGEPDRIADSLAELRTITPPRPAIAPPVPEVLDAFVDGPHWEVVRDYIWVIGNYRPLDPPLDPPEVVRRWVEAVLRGGDSSTALQVVLSLRGQRNPPGADVVDLVRYVADRGVDGKRELDGVQFLATYLLDHSETYERAVAALSVWSSHPDLAAVLRLVQAYVRPADRSALGLSPAG